MQVKPYRDFLRVSLFVLFSDTPYPFDSLPYFNRRLLSIGGRIPFSLGDGILGGVECLSSNTMDAAATWL